MKTYSVVYLLFDNVTLTVDPMFSTDISVLPADGDKVREGDLIPIIRYFADQGFQIVSTAPSGDSQTMMFMQKERKH